MNAHKQQLLLHTTYNFPHILKKSIDSEDGTTVVNRKRHGLPRPQLEYMFA